MPKDWYVIFCACVDTQEKVHRVVNFGKQIWVQLGSICTH